MNNLLYVLSVFLIVIILFFSLYHVMEGQKPEMYHPSRAIAEKTCEMLGVPRDFPDLKVFDCKGEIRVYRYKSK